MALVSNLHFGLSAWSAGAFTAGQRCSNVGNAYQCTASGNSTLAPTGQGSSIISGGATFKWLSAIDYTTFQTWANALPATFTQPAQLLVWNDGPITTTASVPLLTLSGHTTSPSNNITIQPAPGEGFANTGAPPVDPFATDFTTAFGGNGASGTPGSIPLAFNSAAGASVILPTGFGGINYISISDSNVVILGLQFQDPNPTSGATILQPGANFVAQGCIFDGYSQGGGAYMINPSLSGASGSVYKLFNNLIVDRAAASVATATLSSNYSGVLANNTFVALNSPASLGCVIDTSAAAGITINQTNNIMLGYPTQGVVTESQNASTIINVSYALLSASSLTNTQVVAGPGNIYSAPFTGQFVNPATDFRLLPSSQATDTGFTDTADIPSATDIFGNPRIPPWNIGAYETTVPTSVGSGGGQASGAGVSLRVNPTSIGSGAGHASGAGVSLTGSVGSGGGKASGLGVSTGNFSTGSGGGQGGGIAYSTLGAISATITVTNPGAQLVNQAFLVNGTFTLVPDLLVSDDVTVTFTPIPASGVSALGSTAFQFVHPGLPVGTYNLLVEDLSTDASAATNYAVTATAPPPPPPVVGLSVPNVGASLTALGSIIPAYVYQEYSDDQNIQAFFQAYNVMAQGYLDYMNALNLPIYTGLSGTLLDWVALGLYGIQRPVLAAVQFGNLIGPFNTYELDQIPINANIGTSTSTVFPVTDDIFKRIITWNFYKGDGTTFSTTWLKRRVMRFLAGVNGTDYVGPATQVSVRFTGDSTITVALSVGAVPLTMGTVLQAAVLSNVVQLPFQYTINVLV